MIGWRVGWIVAPEALHARSRRRVARQRRGAGRHRAGRRRGRARALARDDLPAYVAELQRRRDVLLRELSIRNRTKKRA